MRGLVTTIAVLLVLAASSSAGKVETIQAAKDVDKVVKLAKRFESRIRRGYDDYCITRELALAYARFGKIEEAVNVIDRHREKFLEGQQDELLKTQVEILASSSRLDEALVIAGVRLERASDHKTTWMVNQQLGELYEQKGDWKRALDHYTHPLPRSKCGKCEDALEHRLAINVARCHFHLGKVRLSLQQLHGLMSGPKPDGLAAMLYCEYAARSGRLVEARKRVEQLPGDRRDRAKLHLAIAEAFAAKDPARMLAILEKPENSLGFIPGWSGPLLVELGPPALKLLGERIRAGSEVAIFLARESGCADLVPALKERLEAVEDPRDRRLLQNALEELEAAAKK